jgi:hypothetical protein
MREIYRYNVLSFFIFFVSGFFWTKRTIEGRSGGLQNAVRSPLYEVSDFVYNMFSKVLNFTLWIAVILEEAIQ